MNSSTRNKILGVFVVIGLVIILLPFFQKSGDVPSTAASVTAPAFPDQAIQVAAPSEDQPVPTSEVPSDIAPMAAATETENPSSGAKANPAAATDASGKVKDVPDDTQALTSNSDGTLPVINVPTGAEPVKNVDKKKPAADAKKVAQAKKPAAKKQVAENTQGPIDDNSLLTLKGRAWVVQLGSFKNKANALRLVNQLRASGYRAFIQKSSTASGESTRVFVGPEDKHDSARTLASKLESDMHLHGIVMSFKPLAL